MIKEKLFDILLFLQNFFFLFLLFLFFSSSPFFHFSICSCSQIEKHLKSERQHKHLILLLNKADLIPVWAAARWVKILSVEYPTVAFHSSITNPFGKMSLINLLRYVVAASSSSSLLHLRHHPFHPSSSPLSLHDCYHHYHHHHHTIPSSFFSSTHFPARHENCNN